MHYSLKDVEELDEFSLHIWIRFHCGLVQRKKLLNYAVELGYVTFKVLHKVFVDPEARQDFEEMTQVLQIWIVLQDVELHL